MELIVISQHGCNPCRMVKNYLNSENVEYTEVNVTEDPSKIDEYNVMSTPVTILLENGEEVARVAGFKPDELETLITQL